MKATEQSLTAKRIELFCLATIITFASRKLPGWASSLSIDIVPHWIQAVGPPNFYYLWTLLFGILLVIASPKRYGIRLGNIRQHAGKTALVCLGPIIITLIVYPNLSVQPFSNAPAGMWLISPLAQDLVFIGFIYTRFDELIPQNIHRLIPIRWALLITGIFFAMWHLPNLQSMPAGYVVFQLIYTFAGCILTGLSRQWTGSIIYVTITHMVVNYIAWSA